MIPTSEEAKSFMKIDFEAENDMVSRGLVPDVDFMSVPHHGSRGSSTQEFLNKAKPEYAVISVGKKVMGILLKMR